MNFIFRLLERETFKSKSFGVSMVNIKVAVRIRPLSERELLYGEEIIVRKENKSVLVTNPKIPERQDGDSRQRTRRFTVDFCYDSSDPEGSTQEEVYKEIGSEVLRSMHEGYNACVLAYGHSASGKTYTIMGLQGDPGLTPRLCEGLFQHLRPEGRIRVQVVISFLEIYNEKVRDLLGSEETGATCGNFSLRVREHPKLGPYVQGLTEHSVADKRKLLHLLAAGNRRRSTAATESNVHSSRSHAVFTIRFKQSDGGNFDTEKSSKVHLVDLAGSERARSSQSKARLQEGANINKSLATLGNVICALAESCDSGIASKEHSNSKTWQPFVPYRDSVLTWLLKDTLGGNSNTIMIATVSPASSCIGETVNTLRYAKRAKKIVNRPIVNEDPKVRTIRELRKEIARLKGLLTFFRSCGRVVDPWESSLGEAVASSRPESKWPEPEGALVTIKGENKEEIWREKRTKEEEEEIKKTKTGEEEEEEEEEEKEKRSSGDWKSGGGREKGGVVWGAGGDACETSDEKKSDVNGSVNDNFSHETQFFSDSLESFSSLLPKSRNSCDAEDVCSGNPGAEDEGLGGRGSDRRVLGLSSTREFGSHENLSKKLFPEMLHRSRPDLIKGISTRARDNGLPLGSSHSCTDVSNLSHSTSENSLNSSGSAEVQPSENRLPQNPRACSSTSSGLRAVNREKWTGKNVARNEASEAGSKKKEKHESADAMPSRLHAAKKKQDHKAEAIKKEETEEDYGDFDEVKLCKRTRMKLFDLSRKLAMSRKLKKTVDIDTQTDFTTGTLRMKEKSVTTDESLESLASEACPKEDKKPYVIMNQVFIPRAASYVVECGEVVRVEGPEVAPRHESATQTSDAGRRFKNADTSPVEFSPREEDCFSEDSLDSGVKRSSRRQVFPGEGPEKDGDLAPETRMTFNWAPNFEIRLSHDFERRFNEESKTQNLTKTENSGKTLFNGLPLPVFMEERTTPHEHVAFFLVDPSENVLESGKAENISSENSFTSTEGTENNSLSETSSEDFVFYENPKDLSQNKAKSTSDRELYTITENSEQSDPSDAFSPVQRQRPSSKGAEERGEPRERIENLQGPHSCGNRPQSRDAKEVEGTFKNICGRLNAKEENARISGGRSEEILGRFAQLFESRKTAPDGPKVPNSAASAARDIDPNNVGQMPNSKIAWRHLGNFSEGSEYRKTAKRCPGCDDEGAAKPANLTDFQFNPQKQYLNLNISSSSTASPFSVDTHLFAKASKKDQSTDTMSTSADSITFVFMGPAKPKTSVLMEIIGRSLGRSSLQSEAPGSQRKSRSRGVQCDAGLMRSVSVDTAMIALSRIARNQEASPEMQRTTSLGKLNPEEILGLWGKGKLRSRLGTSCQCCLDAGYLKEEKKKCSMKCSVGTSTAPGGEEVNSTAKGKAGEAEKPKKSVSWFGGTEFRRSPVLEVDSGEPAFAAGLERANEPKSSPTGADGDLPERRVRFVKEETSDFEGASLGERRGSTDDLKAFLKEATQLLKNINSRSSKQQVFCEESSEEFGTESCRKKEESRKCGFKMSRKTEGITKTRAEGCSEKDANWRWKPAWSWSERKADESQVNLTWPRRRPATGKPPTGTRARLPRSPLSSKPESLHSAGGLGPASTLRSWSQSSRAGSGGQPWNLSNLSVTLSNSYLGDVETRSPSSRSSYCNEGTAHREFGSPPVTSPRRTIDPRSGVDSISSLEMDLEECCRRLEMATEKDKMRKIIQERKMKGLGCSRSEDCFYTGSDDTEDEGEARREKPREALKRRKAEGCAGSCSCGPSGRQPCGRLWSRGCRSSFELDSFGPGSTHCPQLCMFCRKKEAESYSSAVSLNSECSLDLCRLNYYGFCPCSPVKLNQVALSPRAYMQRLLALRKEIVRETQHSEGRRAPRSPSERSDGAQSFS